MKIKPTTKDKIITNLVELILVFIIGSLIKDYTDVSSKDLLLIGFLYISWVNINYTCTYFSHKEFMKNNEE